MLLQCSPPLHCWFLSRSLLPRSLPAVSFSVKASWLEQTHTGSVQGFFTEQDPFRNYTVICACSAKWLWTPHNRSVCIHVDTFIPSSVTSVNSAWQMSRDISVMTSSLNNSNETKVGFYVCLLFISFLPLSCRNVCWNNETRQFCTFSPPNAGDLKTAEILQNTQQKCGEWGERHHNHHAVWEDTFDT